MAHFVRPAVKEKPTSMQVTVIENSTLSHMRICCHYIFGIFLLDKWLAVTDQLPIDA